MRQAFRARYVIAIAICSMPFVAGIAIKAVHAAPSKATMPWVISDQLTVKGTSDLQSDVYLENDETISNSTDGVTTFSGDLEILGNDLDFYDADGFSGIKYSPTTNTGEIHLYINGTKIGHFDTDGAYTDDVP